MMKLKVAVVALLVGAFDLVGFGMSRLVGNGTRGALLKNSAVQAPVKIDEQPTPVQVGVVSEKQRVHSRLFNRYRSNEINGDQLLALLEKTGKVDIENYVPDLVRPRTFDLNNYFRTTKCKADAVIVGTVKNKSSQLIDEGTFTFTDYDVGVDDTLTSGSAATTLIGNNVTVTRFGGAIAVKGRTIRAVDDAERPLLVGHQYLLFLRFIPETGAYKSLALNIYDDSFQISNDRIAQVSDMPLERDLDLNLKWSRPLRLGSTETTIISDTWSHFDGPQYLKPDRWIINCY